MKSRKKYVIDKKFQYGKSIRLIGVVTIILTAVIISVGIMISVNNRKIVENNRLIMNNLDNIKNIIELQQKIYLSFQTIPYGVDKKTFTAIAGELTNDYNKSTQNLNASSTANEKIIASNDHIMKSNTFLILAVIASALAGIAILFIIMIRHTHRISGPIYLMSLYAKEILDGGKPEMRNLRD